MSKEETKGYKCPCCNNPWSVGAGDGADFQCLVCAPTTTNTGISRDHLDPSTKPADNFYQYSNGNWLTKNPIPPGYPNWNSFLILHTQAQEQLKEILQTMDGTSSSSTSSSEEESKVGAFYRAAMEEEFIESAGVESLSAVLKLVEEIVVASHQERPRLLGRLAQEYGIDPFFSIGVSPDNSNTDHSIVQVSQGGLGLPDRDYYFDEDKQAQREAYVPAMARLLALLLEQEEDALLPAATQVLELETSLAKEHMTKTENRDPHDTYNKMSIADFNQMAEWDFGAYLEAATGKTVDELGEINVRNARALQCVGTVLRDIEAVTLKTYLQWMVVKSCAPYLSTALVQAHFDFFEKTLMGTQEIKPRWKRAMAFTESALGEALGKLYCAKFFDESSKERALQVVEQVRQALEERLKEVEWMTADSTREEALKKMSKFGVKIGYPDKWTDYSTLKITPDMPFLQMVFEARKFHNLKDVKEMNAPTDRKKWFMTPQTINAYYHPNLNEIVFPAAILQPPFFNASADDAVNFGAMGAVIGHEMTHGFDDKGRKFNFAGTLTDWWTEADATEYEGRVQVMVDQANAYQVHGQFVQGKLTSGENIADLGGLRLALRALKASKDFNSHALIDGFTPVQRFFLSWSQCWRQNITKERSLQLLTIDPHGPNEMRCNGPLSNMPEFHEAFDVNEGDPMYLPPDRRVDIW